MLSPFVGGAHSSTTPSSLRRGAFACAPAPPGGSFAALVAGNAPMRVHVTPAGSSYGDGDDGMLEGLDVLTPTMQQRGGFAGAPDAGLGLVEKGARDRGGGATGAGRRRLVGLEGSPGLQVPQAAVCPCILHPGLPTRSRLLPLSLLVSHG